MLSLFTDVDTIITLYVYVRAYLYLDRPNHVMIGQMSYHSIEVILWSV